MKAHHLTSSGRKLGLKKILRDEPNCTIIVATRHYGYDKAVKCFIIGCQGDYGVKTGDVSSYTIDTGNGYSIQGENLDIEHVIQVEGGEVKKGFHNAAAAVGLENRYTWVMK